jgi:membrane-bound serine protease (ClpP class)
MEPLYNANLAYVLLVVGFVFAMLAILTPGTGVIEIVALFLLTLAGVAVFHLSFNTWALIVLVLAVIPFIYAIRKPKREWALALSILGLLVGSLYLFPASGLLPAVNPFLAIVVSVLVAGFLWLAVRKVMAAFNTRPVQDLQKVVGMVGQAKTHIKDEGSVQVGGELWSARSEEEIPPGTWVRVLNREGFVLIVAADEQSKK